MTARTNMKSQGVKMDVAIDFLRKSALVKEISGKPALTSKGERLLYELLESSSLPRIVADSPDDSSFSEGTVCR
jgi:hypothetical protein